MKRCLLLVLTALALQAQTKPKLVVIIVVDQFRAVALSSVTS